MIETEQQRKQRLGIYYEVVRKQERGEPLTDQEQRLEDQRRAACKAAVEKERRR